MWSHWRMELQVVTTNRKSVCDLGSKEISWNSHGYIKIEARRKRNVLELSCSFFEFPFYFCSSALTSLDSQSLCRPILLISSFIITSSVSVLLQSSSMHWLLLMSFRALCIHDFVIDLFSDCSMRLRSVVPWRSYCGLSIHKTIIIRFSPHNLLFFDMIFLWNVVFAHCSF